MNKVRKLMKSMVKTFSGITPQDLEKAFNLIYKAGYSDGSKDTSKKLYRQFEKILRQERR